MNTLEPMSEAGYRRRELSICQPAPVIGDEIVTGAETTGRLQKRGQAAVSVAIHIHGLPENDLTAQLERSTGLDHFARGLQEAKEARIVPYGRHLDPS
jgi:hypothetical protein